MTLPVYLDHHATTACAPEVVDAILPWLAERPGNAGVRHHVYGQRAEAAVDAAREQVAAAIGAEPAEIVWTSGATEADNLAILGVADALEGPRHVVVGATEHRAVLDPARALAARGWEVTEVPPGPDGIVTAEAVEAALGPRTALVSVMLANNEVGVIQPVAAIAALCRARGVWCHTDAAQALGKLPLDVRALGVDLLSLSAHKAYGPQGVGALWVRRGRPMVPLEPRQRGGGQERGRRSGTVPVGLVAGFGVAAALALRDLDAGEPERLATLRDRLADALLALEGVVLRGARAPRLPHNLHVTVDGARSADLLAALRHEVACSAGSACSSTDARPSHVLLAMGLSEEEARGALRFGLGRSTRDEDVDRAVEALRRCIPAARARRIPSSMG